MTNVEKLVDFINEQDPSGKLFERFVAFFQLGLIALGNNAEATGDDGREA